MAATILTVGYGNRTIDSVIGLLRNECVQYLVDVRTNPQSKFNPDFSAEPLEGALRRVAIKYVLMGDTLGGRPSDLTCYENGHVIYERVQTRTFFQEGIGRLLKALNQNLKVCLLCSESRPEDCHRSKLIGVALANLGIDLVHLGANGERLTQAQVLRTLESSQGDLFGLSLRSRRAYKPFATRTNAAIRVRSSE
jgi:uncharacterized protein (DUF488 family)